MDKMLETDYINLQIFPTHVRAKGLCISASAGSVGSIIVAQFWPIAMQTVQSRTYFIFMVTNIAAIILIVVFFPETKGKTLEELDNLFRKRPLIGDGNELYVITERAKLKQQTSVEQIVVQLNK
ncbi:hypothetical protein MMC32_007304 [Xylographa parallela]|nr:hypothetical protein [Xylographa parallela]